jgi:glycosyltransferase involved in cell wall biosynthesis
MTLTHSQAPEIPRKRKVVHMTSVHPAFDVRIFHKECVSLADAGFAVVLIAPHDHDEMHDGVQIRAVPKPSSRRERMTRTTWQVFQRAILERADVYHFHDPELLLFGMLLKLMGKCVVYDVHENVPEDIMTKKYIPVLYRATLARIVGGLERLGAGLFDRVIAVTGAIAGRFFEGKTVVVQNYPLLAETSSGTSTPHENRPHEVAYIGVVLEVRGIFEMVEGISRVPEHFGARLVLAGSFNPPTLKAEATAIQGWAHVESHSWVSRAHVGTILERVRAGLVLFHPGPNHLEAQPNKLFEYMAAGLPVIASDFPLWREIVAGADCGLLIDPLNPDAIAGAIQWVLEHPQEAQAMGQRGRKAILAQYHWEREAAKLLEMYGGIA